MIDTIYNNGVAAFHWAEEGIYSLHLPEKGASFYESAAKAGSIFLAWAATPHGIGILSLSFGGVYLLLVEDALDLKGNSRHVAKAASIVLLVVAGAHLFS